MSTAEPVVTAPPLLTTVCLECCLGVVAALYLLFTMVTYLMTQFRDAHVMGIETVVCEGKCKTPLSQMVPTTHEHC